MKTLLSAALVAATVSLAIPLSVTEAGALDRNDRIPICDYYRVQAYSASRRGDYDLADHYWRLYRACLDHRIN